MEAGSATGSDHAYSTNGQGVLKSDEVLSYAYSAEEILELTTQEQQDFAENPMMFYSAEEEFISYNYPGVLDLDPVVHREVVEDCFYSAGAVREKFDTGDSKNMSGNFQRTKCKYPVHDAHVRGFNGTTSRVTHRGVNDRRRPEEYLPGMPEDLVLVSAIDSVGEQCKVRN